MLYVDGMSDKLLLEQSVVKPLLSMKWAGVGIADVKKLPYGEEIKEIEETAAGQTVANGDLVLALDGAEKLYEISLRNYPHRAVAEPPTETVIKRPARRIHRRNQNKRVAGQTSHKIAATESEKIHRRKIRKYNSYDGLH